MDLRGHASTRRCTLDSGFTLSGSFSAFGIMAMGTCRDLLLFSLASCFNPFAKTGQSLIKLSLIPRPNSYS